MSEYTCVSYCGQERLSRVRVPSSVVSHGTGDRPSRREALDVVREGKAVLNTCLSKLGDNDDSMVDLAMATDIACRPFMELLWLECLDESSVVSFDTMSSACKAYCEVTLRFYLGVAARRSAGGLVWSHLGPGGAAWSLAPPALAIGRSYAKWVWIRYETLDPELRQQLFSLGCSWIEVDGRRAVPANSDFVSMVLLELLEPYGMLPGAMHAADRALDRHCAGIRLVRRPQGDVVALHPESGRAVLGSAHDFAQSPESTCFLNLEDVPDVPLGASRHVDWRSLAGAVSASRSTRLRGELMSTAHAAKREIGTSMPGTNFRVCWVANGWTCAVTAERSWQQGRRDHYRRAQVVGVSDAELRLVIPRSPYTPFTVGSMVALRDTQGVQSVTVGVVRRFRRVSKTTDQVDISLGGPAALVRCRVVPRRMPGEEVQWAFILHSANSDAESGGGILVLPLGEGAAGPEAIELADVDHRFEAPVVVGTGQDFYVLGAKQAGRQLMEIL